MTDHAWFKTLPAGWAPVELKWVARIYSGGTPDRSRPEFWTDGDIPWLASGCVNQWKVTEPSEYITKKGFEASSARFVPRGAVLIGLAGQGKTKGTVALSLIEATINQSVAAIVCGPVLDPRFLHYWLSVNHSNIRGLSGGDLRDGLNHGHVGAIPVPLPPRVLQTRIADFLDRETATIGALIEKQGQMKALLLERRRTAIDSCFPREADTRLSNVLHLCQTGPFGTQLSASEYIEGGVPVINPTHIVGSAIVPNAAVSVTAEKADALSRHDLVAGDIVLGRKGEVDKSALVSPGHPRMLLGSDSMLLRVDGERADPRYIWWWLQSPGCHGELERLSVGSTVAGLNQRIISVLALPKPSLKEQREIADHLDRETAKIDALIAKAERFIELAQERRAALITAAVTGQIEIPTED